MPLGSTFFALGYLGCSYDLLKGNPRSTDPLEGVDPGFGITIFNLTEYSGEVTPDLLYEIPKGVQANECNKCSLDFTYTEASGAKAYQDMLKESVSFSAGGYNTEFYCNKEMQEIQKSTSSYQDVVTETDSSCCVYTSNIITSDPPSFTTGFTNEVANMPTVYNEETSPWFDSFQRSFGTHVTISMTSGGRYGQRSTFSKEAWSTMSSSNYVVQSGASASAWGASAAVDIMSEEEKKQAETFSSYSETQSTYTVGGEFPPDGSVTTWMNSCKDAPMPISYKLYDIPTILSPAFFPDDENIFAKSQALYEANMAYCAKQVEQGLVESCDALEPDPPFPPTSIMGGMYTVNDNGSGIANPYTGTTSCLSGYEAYNIGRSVHPESNTGQQTYLCLSSLIEDPMTFFGGAFQKDDEEQNDSRVNPMTEDMTCPEGYVKAQYGRVTTAEPHRYGASQFYCYNPEIPVGSNPLGGFYQKSDGGTQDMIANVYTKGYSCPAGYTAYQFGRQLTPESHYGANQYICLNNVY